MQYLVLKGINIVVGLDVAPTVDGDTVTWPEGRINGATVAQVPDNTWTEAMGYRKTWNGSVVGDQPALPSDPNDKYTPYADLKEFRVRVVYGVIGKVLTKQKWREFDEHWVSTTLAKATGDVVDFTNTETLDEIIDGLDNLIADTAVEQSDVDQIIGGLLLYQNKKAGS